MATTEAARLLGCWRRSITRMEIGPVICLCVRSVSCKFLDFINSTFLKSSQYLCHWKLTPTNNTWDLRKRFRQLHLQVHNCRLPVYSFGASSHLSPYFFLFAIWHKLTFCSDPFHQMYITVLKSNQNFFFPEKSLSQDIVLLVCFPISR